MKKKIILSERNDPYQNPGNKYIRRLRDVLYEFSDGIVFQTIDAKNYFSKSIQKKGIIISNPIIPGLPYWNENNQNKTIITACRLSTQKNLPMLIEAFSRLREYYPDYTLKIYGIGEMREELLSIIEESGLKDKVLLQDSQMISITK
nr:glycosyltransferase [Thalassobacillus sp. C254]